MKKTTLALMMMGLGVVSASSNAAEIYNKDGNKLDLYGKLRAEHYFSDDSTQNGDKSYFRLGFKGETQVNDQVTGFGRWESEFAGSIEEGNTGSNPPAVKTRLAFAGVKVKTLGSIDYGRNLGILYDAASVTDMLPEFGGDSLTRTDNFMTKRTTGVATYRNTDFFGVVNGLNLGLQYQGKNESGRSSAAKQNGDGFGTSLSYNFGGSPVTLIGAYAKSDRTTLQNTQALGKGDNAEAWISGVKYDANNIYLAAMYSIAQNMTPIGSKGFANTSENFEAVAQYQFNFGLRPSLAFVQTRGKDLERGYDDQDLVKYIDVGATYFLNKNISLMVDYKINQIDKNAFTTYAGISTDDIVAVGVTYQF